METVSLETRRRDDKGRLPRRATDISPQAYRDQPQWLELARVRGLTYARDG